MASGANIRAGGAYVELFTRDRLAAGLRAAQARMKAFGSALQNIGQRIAMVGAAAAIPLGLAAQRFASFDDKMRIVRAVTQGSQEDFERLSNFARELGATTSFTAVQVADLMGELGKAGFSTEQIEGATAAVLNLARATGTEAALSAKIMVTTLSQFQLGFENAARVANGLTVAANASLSSVESLGESLSYAGPVARDFNMSLEDTLAILGVLSNLGIEGSMAGTALRRMLIITGAEAQKVGEIFGVVATDAAGGARPLVDILGEIGEATKGLGTAARAQKFNELFGLLGITGASGISRSVGDVRKLRAELNGMGDAAATQARMMDAGLGGALRRLMGSVEGAAIAVGEALGPALALVAHLVKIGIGRFRDWIKENKVVAGAVGFAVVAVVALGSALLVLGIMFKLLAVAMAVPLAIFGLLKLMALTWIMAFKSVFFFVLKAADLIGSRMVISATTTSGALSTIMQGFRAVGSVAVSTFAAIKEAIEEGDWDSAMTIAMNGISTAFDVMVSHLKIAWRNFKGYWTDLWDDMILRARMAPYRMLSGGSIGNTLSDIFGGGAGGRVLARIGELFGLVPAGTVANLQADAQQNANAVAAATAANPDVVLLQAAHAAEQARILEARQIEDWKDLINIHAAALEHEQFIQEQAGERLMRWGANFFAEQMQAMGQDAAALVQGGPGPGLEDAMSKMESRGTFSAFSAFGLGANTLAERLDQTNNHLERIEQHVRPENQNAPIFRP